jgi:long-chain acyl-CoA synthetase
MRTDESALITVPLSQKSISKSEGYHLIGQFMEIMGSVSTSPSKPKVGLSFDDPKNWIISIVAAQPANVVAVPIPKEFTTRQISSFVPDLDFVLTDSSASSDRLAGVYKNRATVAPYSLANDTTIFLVKSEVETQPHFKLPPDTVSIIHTSGSTDSPKGVVVSEQGLSGVVRSMLERTSQLGQVNYVSILPFSLLLEQVLGIYLPILTGGSISVLPESVGCYIGTQGSLDPYLETICSSGANFAMVPPSFLDQLRKHAEQSQQNPRSYFGEAIKVVATGGAPIDLSCLEYFREHQLEIYQGYGLSENTSVVAWNYPGPNVLGSVGRPLGHNHVQIGAHGQVEVSGESLFLGYVKSGEFSPRKQGPLNTGDVGYFDQDGNLFITGRDANLIVLSSGRNVAPEWIESKFKRLSGVKDLVVIGHGKPALAAIILVDKEADRETVLQRVEAHAANIAGELPEFVRLSAFKAIQFEDQFYSVSGRIVRARVLESCSDWINNLRYDGKSQGVPECKTISY